MHLFFTLLLCLVPACFTFLSFLTTSHAPIFYTTGKIVIIAIPILFWSSCKSFAEFKEKIGLKKTNCLYGIASGLTIALFIISSYYLFFQYKLNANALYDRINKLGIIPYYWILAVFISLWNSFIEEYYWRAFILGRFPKQRPVLSCVANGALFGIHHFIILSAYFPTSLALFFTIGTAIGGIFWAWLRLRGFSIIDCYISHIFADIAVMWIGWQMIAKMM